MLGLVEVLHWQTADSCYKIFSGFIISFQNNLAAEIFLSFLQLEFNLSQYLRKLFYFEIFC